LIGGAGGNRFTVSGWIEGILTVDGRGGADTLIAQADDDVNLSDDRYVRRATGAPVSLTSIEAAELTGSSNDNRFTLNGFTGAVTVAGGGGRDTIADGEDVHMTLTP